MRRTQWQPMGTIHKLVTAIAELIGIDAAQDPELTELAQDVAPEQVLDTMEAHERQFAGEEAREQSHKLPPRT